MYIKDAYKVGDILRVLFPFDTKRVNNQGQQEYIMIDGKYYYADRKAIVIGYSDDCTFKVSLGCAFAIDSQGKIFLIHNNYVWKVVGHCELSGFMQDTLNKEDC